MNLNTSNQRSFVDLGQPPPFSRETPVYPQGPMHSTDIGIFKSTIFPSFSLQTGLSIATYIAARASDRGEVKDWNWPASQVITAWWHALGRPVCFNEVPLSTAWSTLPWNEKLLLGAVTTWGTRLFYRIASRSIARGSDDPRYTEVKKEPGFWNSAFLKMFLPEAAFLTVITLPLTLPFGSESSSVSLGRDATGLVRALAVGLFSAGFALETIADVQLETHVQSRKNELCRSGVWSIVRHPNYLGDALVQASFVVFNVASHFNPLVLLGPVANYFFLRLIGGDKFTEESQEARYAAQNPRKLQQLQESRQEKNSFWPGVRELTNPWTWAVVGLGVAGVAVEEGARAYFL